MQAKHRLHAAPATLVADRVEDLVSQKHAARVSHREEASKRIGGDA